MNEGPHTDSERLARYLSGEADAAERLGVEQWAASDPANARELEFLRTVWRTAEGVAAPVVDVDAAWNKASARIAEAEGRGRVIHLGGRTKALRWLAAAAVVTGLFVGVRFLMDDQHQDLMASTEHLRSTLADSSVVTLSPGSRLSARMSGERHIDLDGEAYFDVKRDTKRPFVVETDDVTVTVLGTAFEVSAFDTASSVLVRVRHGKVRVLAGSDSVVLVAGGYARYNKAAHILERLAAPPAEVWGDRIIQFQDAPMPEVIEQLQRLFPVKVRLGNEGLAKCQLSATFEDEPIDYILRVIADTYELTLTEETPGSYVLDGAGC
ncbi:MAG TPA: FecR domain-containing protein [Flavobacteriales bacterium]|nr:FecR domain-containing protein [Flavobacteriales bacterium]